MLDQAGAFTIYKGKVCGQPLSVFLAWQRGTLGSAVGRREGGVVVEGRESRRDGKGRERVYLMHSVA